MIRTINALIFLGAMGFLLLQIGCAVSVGKHPETVYAPQHSESRPPPWAPAHGHRSKYRYYYYPETHVYFDTGRALYFYYSGDGWRASVSLPSEIRINVGDHVELEMDHDRPYRYHNEVVKRYPPGQLKKIRKDKHKRWD